MTWISITEDDLYDLIHAGEKKLNGPHLKLWDLLKITPMKWQEEKYGQLGGGFWVVGIIGSLVIWYNDIEDGFNISPFRDFGVINGYYCNQDELNQAVLRIYTMIDLGMGLIGQSGGPFPGAYPGSND